MSVTSIKQCKNLRASAIYCTTPKKDQTRERVAYMHCDLGSVKQFLQYAEATIKSHRRKIQGYTLLQSFSSHEFSVDNHSHIMLVNFLGQQLAQALYANSPCLVITHADSLGQCLHNHILVINHDLETDGCIKNNRHFRYVKKANDRLMRSHGYEVCKGSDTKQSQGEYWSNKRNHWLDQLKDSLDKALSQATTMLEFRDYLQAEGVASSLYKSNGFLREKFTYQVMDSDGKLHKKRSDKLGADYTRESIQKRINENRRKRSLEAQKTIMPMSDWIEAQKRLNEEITIDVIPQVENVTTDTIKLLSENNNKKEQDNAPEMEYNMTKKELLLREEERMEKQLRIDALRYQMELCKKHMKEYRNKLNNYEEKEELTPNEKAERNRLSEEFNKESMLLAKHKDELTLLESSDIKLNPTLVSTHSKAKENDFSK